MADAAVPYPPQLVRVPLGSGGCYLLLTPQEWRRGIARGKRDRRARAHARRQRAPVATDSTPRTLINCLSSGSERVDKTSMAVI
jgi:hypothetical protein